MRQSCARGRLWEEPMKIIIPGGTGQVGNVLSRAFLAQGHEVVVLSRGSEGVARTVRWDGRSVGAWASELDGGSCRALEGWTLMMM